MSKTKKINLSEDEIPERCPNCNKKMKNVLLHIRAKESCYRNIDEKLFEKWRILSRKLTTKKKQKTYVKSGGHTKAQNKYLEKKRALKEKELLPRRLRYDFEAKMGQHFRDFLKMCQYLALYLVKGRTLPNCMIKNFDLNDEKLNEVKYTVYKRNNEVMHREVMHPNEKERHHWLRNIKASLLEAVMTLQTVLLIPESQWLNAMKAVETNSDMKIFRERLFRLIGRLQAYKTENTQNLKIDEIYTTRPKIVDEETWKIKQSFSSEVTKREEKVLLVEVEGLLKDDLLDTRFQDLLGITEKMDNLFVALAFSSHDEAKELSTGPWRNGENEYSRGGYSFDKPIGCNISGLWKC